MSVMKISHGRYLLILSVLFLAVWIALAISPLYRDDWALENALVIVFAIVVAASYRHLLLSRVSYVLPIPDGYDQRKEIIFYTFRNNPDPVALTIAGFLALLVLFSLWYGARWLWRGGLPSASECAPGGSTEVPLPPADVDAIERGYHGLQRMFAVVEGVTTTATSIGLAALTP